MTTLENKPLTSPPVWEGVSERKEQIWKAQGFFRRHADLFFIAALTLIGLGIRLAVSRGFWLDEATSVAEARMSFFRMISYLRQSDVHPPLYQAILWLDIRAFGSSEIAVRLPSTVIGTALIPVLYGAGRELFNKRTARIAALFATLAPVEIWYSQEARMYPLFMLFATLAIWAQVRAIRTGSRKAWISYALATAALLWTQYFTVLLVLVQQLAFVALIWQQRGTDEGRRLRNTWLKCIFGLVLLIGPLATFPYGQIAHYGLRDTTTVASDGSVSSGAPLYTAISNISSAFIGYHSDNTMTKVNALWPVAMLIGLVALGRGRSRVTLLLMSSVAIPMGILFIIGLKRNDVFELRYFAGAVPVLILLSARAVSLLAKKKAALVLACVVISLGLVGSLADEQLSGGNGRVFDFRSVLQAANTQEQPGDLMLYEPFYLHPTVHYYAPKFTSFPLVAGLTSTTAPKRIFIVDSLAFAEKEQSAARVNQIVTRLKQDRHLVAHVQKDQIEMWEFQ